MFQQIAEMGHERILLCSNPEVGLKAIIAVHSTVLGPGLGGLRMYPFKDFEEAMTDALRLSRGMTYKAAAAGLNLGGGDTCQQNQDKKKSLDTQEKASMVKWQFFGWVCNAETGSDVANHYQPTRL